MFGLKAESDQLLHLDCLRVVASVGVVIYHAAGYAGWDIGDFRFFVEIFFAISGYLIAYIYSARLPTEYPRFIIGRIARIAPLHWATLLFMAALATATGALSSPTFDPKCLVPNILAIHSFGVCGSNTFNGPSWSISASLAMYALAPWLLAWSRRSWMVLAFLLAATAMMIAGVDWAQWTYDGGAIRAIPSFLLGAWLYHGRAWIARIPSKSSTVWIATALFAVTVFLAEPGVLSLVLAYSVVVLAVAADLRKASSQHITRLAPLSLLTFASFLVHVPVLTMIASRPALRMWGMEAHADAMTVLAVLLSFPASYIAHVAFERPMRRWINGRRISAVASGVGRRFTRKAIARDRS